MTQEIYEKADWLQGVYDKSESARSRRVADVSVNMFGYFCKNEGLTEGKMVKKYQTWKKEDDIRSIGISLQKFVSFLNHDQDIILNEEIAPRPFKKLTSKTIRTYFGFVKAYLRKCHDVRLSIEDIKDFITFPTPRKESRKAISLETLKLLFDNASPSRRALYYVLISSGMRLGEALSLTPDNFHLDENPARITIDADYTKTKESRETYISSEAVEKLKPIIQDKKNDEKVLSDIDEISQNDDDDKSGHAVRIEDQYFKDLRIRLDLLEKYKNSNRYVINIHGFRSYFHTKASQKHGSEYANALDGHGAYLKTYYNLSPDERAKKYKELESSLFIESYKLESEKTKDKKIQDLENKMQELQSQMERWKLINANP